jgi:hypothetical protein
LSKVLVLSCDRFLVNKKLCHGQFSETAGAAKAATERLPNVGPDTS